MSSPTRVVSQISGSETTNDSGSSHNSLNSRSPIATGAPSERLLQDQIELARGQTAFKYPSGSMKYEEIRLLELLPGEREQCIRCRLFRTFLSSDPVFEALSYVWDPPDLPQAARNARPTVECDGAVFDVGFNLYCALLNLREKDKPRIIWCDAICINQADLEERAMQVMFMSKIYSRATCVNVWLGLDSMGLAERTIEMILDTLDLFKEFEGRYVHELEGEKGKKLVSDYKSLLCFKKHSDVSFSEGQRLCRTGIRQIFGGAWYDRVWVQSEISLAQEACAFWGTESISWTSLMDFALIQNQLLSAKLVDGDQTSSLAGLSLASAGTERVVNLLNNLWHTYGNASSWIYKLRDVRYWDLPTMVPHIALLNVLYTTTTLGATNPRDHIYAFRGHPAVRPLFEDPGKVYCIVDYSWPVVNVYHAVAEYLLDEMQSLHLLSCVRRGLSLTPTWVPRWTTKRGQRWIQPLAAKRSHDRFRASEGYPSVLESSQRLFEMHRFMLRVRGTIAHEIATVFPITTKGFNNCFLKAGMAAMKGMLPLEASPTWKLFCDTISIGGQWYASNGDDVDLETLSIRLLLLIFTLHNAVSPRLGSFPTNTDLQEVENLAAGKGFTPENPPCQGRAFFLTRDGNMGLGPLHARPGDKCCVVFGGQTPFVFRPCGGSEYKLVEECYIPNLMRGEAMDMIKDGKLEQMTFDLI